MAICLIRNNRFHNVEHIYSFVPSLTIHAFILHFFLMPTSKQFCCGDNF